MTPSAWERTLEELLRGLNHALSNRLSLVMTAGQYLQLGEADPAEIGAMLLEESEKVDQLLQLLRLLPRAPNCEVGPFSIASCLEETSALLAHHAHFRSALPRIVGAEGQSPVTGDEVLVTRFLLAACIAASGTIGHSAEVVVRESEGYLILAISGSPSIDRGANTPVVREIEDLALSYSLAFRWVDEAGQEPARVGELRLPLMRQSQDRREPAVSSGSSVP